MSLLKTIRAQLGLSNTAANNFTLDASADNGTMKLARGNAGATTQDIMTVDAAGKVTFPQGVSATTPVIRAVQPTDTAFNVGSGVDCVFTQVLENVGGTWSAASIWTPNVAGWYQVNATLLFTASPSAGFLSATIYGNNAKNLGGAIQVQPPYASQFGGLCVSGLIYCNGTTDTIKVVGEINGATAGTERGGSSFSAVLVRRD